MIKVEIEKLPELVTWCKSFIAPCVLENPFSIRGEDNAWIIELDNAPKKRKKFVFLFIKDTKHSLLASIKFGVKII